MLFKCINNCGFLISDYSTNAFKKNHYCSKKCNDEHSELFN